MSLRKHVFRLTLAGTVLGAGTLAEAQSVPPAAPVGPAPTIWHFLGLRQGSWMRRDAFLNKRGNFPGLERKPPLKRLADPSLAEVDNAAIKKAQQIKAEEELAPQKIKAIKYLATIGCGKCYEGVDEALLESLKDCTEEVRYETVRALGSIPDAQCPMCDGDCCTEAITEQLAKMAYERDPKHPDCWYEPSARVREAARESLNACCPNRGAPPMAEPIEERPPVEGGPTRPPVEGGTSAWRGQPSNNALFGGMFSRAPNHPTRPPAQYYRPTPQTVAAQPQYEQPQYPAAQAMRTPTVWVADATTRPDAAVDVETSVEATSEPTSEAAVEDSPVADAEHAAAEPQVVVDEQVDAAPYVEPAPVAEQPLSAPRAAEPQPPADEPVLQPVIRQPSNLTLRAKQPALFAALPEANSEAEAVGTTENTERFQPTPAQPVAAERPNLIQQPANFGNAVRRASVEEPAAYVEAIEQEQPAQPHATDIQTTRQSTGNARSTPVRPAAARSAPAARGVVAKVSAAAGTVQLRFAGGTQPAIGSRVAVQHKYLLSTAEVGELEIVAVGSNMVTARPIGDTNLSKISTGDVVVLPAR